MSKRSEAKRKPCANCNKSLTKIQRFYRNGKYFCNKECFRSLVKKEAEKPKE